MLFAPCCLSYAKQSAIYFIMINRRSVFEKNTDVEIHLRKVYRLEQKKIPKRAVVCYTLLHIRYVFDPVFRYTHIHSIYESMNLIQIVRYTLVHVRYISDLVVRYTLVHIRYVSDPVVRYTHLHIRYVSDPVVRYTHLHIRYIFDPVVRYTHLYQICI